MPQILSVCVEVRFPYLPGRVRTSIGRHTLFLISQLQNYINITISPLQTEINISDINAFAFN